MQKNEMTTDEAMKMLGVSTGAALARLIGTSRQTIHEWGGTVPAMRQYQIRELERLKSASDGLDK